MTGVTPADWITSARVLESAKQALFRGESERASSQEILDLNLFDPEGARR